MDFTRKNTPYFHQTAIISALVLSSTSATALADRCAIFPTTPLIVNTTSESDDFCDEKISLREAITYANETLGNDTVTFSESLKGSTVEVIDGRIEINESVSITGRNDAEMITLKASSDSQLFDIKSEENINFDMKNMILEKESGNEPLIKMISRGGNIVLDNIKTTSNTNAAGIFKADIVNDKDLTLTLKNSMISGSTFSKPIVEIEGGKSSAKLNITIEENTISPAASAGLVHGRNYDDGDVTINIVKTNISGGDWRNTSGEKGSIIVHAQSRGTVNITLSDSSIQNITNAPFSMIDAYGSNGLINIKHSKITGNNQGLSQEGVAIYATDVDLHIQDSTIAQNQFFPVLALVDEEHSRSVVIDSTTIADNDTGGKGSAVMTHASEGNLDFKVSNSTISGNKPKDGRMSHVSGISISSNDTATVNFTLENSTITNNHGFNYGGGIALENSGNTDNITATIINSIVAGNTSSEGSDHDLLGTFNIQNSLIGDTKTTNGTTINGVVIDQIGNGEGQTPDSGNNIFSQDPLLQNLAISGGMLVQQLSADSPVIAAGDASVEKLSEFDQRGEGFARVRNVNGSMQLDMGAVQYFAKPVAVNDTISVEKGSVNNLINVLKNDAQSSDGLALDSGSIVIMTHPEQGKAEVQQDGNIVYTPNIDFVGTDALIYVVQDIDGNTSNQATVNISVTDVEVIPKESKSSSGGGSLNFWLLSLLAVFGLRRK